jgi:hypothetical protein
VTPIRPRCSLGRRGSLADPGKTDNQGDDSPLSRPGARTLKGVESLRPFAGGGGRLRIKSSFISTSVTHGPAIDTWPQLGVWDCGIEPSEAAGVRSRWSR